MSQGFYELLGVEAEASHDTIRQAYQVRLARLVRRLRTARQNGADVTILEAQERSLREAREILSAPARRRRYDAFRRAMDGGVPDSAQDLWEQVRNSLVAPEESLALASVKALTDLPLGQPVPAPSEPARVQRVESDAGAYAAAPVAASRGPERPTLVPPTDPGIEITLSDDELAWLEHPPTPAPVPAAPILAEVHPDPAWAEDTWSDRVDARIAQTDPDRSIDYDRDTEQDEDEYDYEDDDYGDDFDDFDDHDLRPTDTPEAGSAIPGLGFLSRLSLPKPPAWSGGDGPRDETGDGPSLVSIPHAHRTEPPASVAGTGPFLRETRESLGISLDELSKSTRISTRYLEAIEADDFERLPSPIFVKGYLKQVVEQLGLDADGVVESFMAAYHSRRG
ncbi:MAG: hypothetical protein CL927_13565 [Deltaproteobacteria bacterium]|nr:hypothetical protein [Deltaproteobacteria bacterium]